MKIIIIGAGIAGLSSYIFLDKHLPRDHLGDCSVKIYEAYDVKKMKYDAPGRKEVQDPQADPLFTPKVIGNAIGLGKNGLAVLKRMDKDGRVLKQIQRKGNCVAKWRMCTARGWRIVDANVQSPIKDLDNDDGKIADTVMIARQVAWEVLRDQVLSIDENAVVKQKVSAIEYTADGKVMLHFIDGSKEEADLVIGADGLRSIVRQTMFRDNQDVEPQSWLQWLTRRSPKKKDYITPHYEGLTGLGGFVPSEVLKKTDFDHSAMSITFGPNGFFGHGYIGPVNQGATDNDGPLAAWWSTFSSDSPQPYQKSGDVGSNPESGVSAAFDRQRALKECLQRHRFWSDPTIQAILDYLEENQAIEHIYPTYTTPELPTWKSGSNIVLVGDAAHALQPSSGQGACQAMEDAEALALLLKHYLRTPAPSSHFHSPETQQIAVNKALSNYVEFRKPRIAKIYKQSQKMSSRKMDMNIVAEYIMYFAIWVGTKLQTWKAYNEELFEYDLPKEVEKAVRVYHWDPENLAL